MAKNFILNVLLNLAIVFLILAGVSAYNSGNALILGLCIAFMVLVAYLKIVLVKHVRRNYSNRSRPVNKAVGKRASKKRK